MPDATPFPLGICCVTIEGPDGSRNCDQRPTWNVTVFSEHLTTRRKSHVVYPYCDEHAVGSVEFTMQADETRQIIATWRGAYE